MIAFGNARPVVPVFLPDDCMELLQEPIETTKAVRPRSSWLRPIPLLLIVSSIAGAVVSFGYGKTLADLRQEHQNLVSIVGSVEIDDPDRVYITAVSPEAIEIPEWIKNYRIWRFRIYVPADYGVAFLDRRGLIAANSPRGSSSGGSSWGSAKKEPIEIQVTLTLMPTKTGWQICRVSSGGSVTADLPSELDLDSLDDNVLEPIVGIGEPAKSFPADGAICLFRLRSTTPGKSKRSNRPKQKASNDLEPLYPGYALYLLDSDRREAFNDWASGKTDRMVEPPQ